MPAVDQLPLLCRGQLLLTLAQAMGAPTARGLLQATLAPFYASAPERSFDRDVDYLVGKGLIIVEGRRFGAFAPVEVLMLTPAGQDVVEGTITVPGVAIQR